MDIDIILYFIIGSFATYVVIVGVGLFQSVRRDKLLVKQIEVRLLNSGERKLNHEALLLYISYLESRIRQETMNELGLVSDQS